MHWTGAVVGGELVWPVVIYHLSQPVVVKGNLQDKFIRKRGRKENQFCFFYNGSQLLNSRILFLKSVIYLQLTT